MLLMPDPGTAWIDPFMQITTLSLICNIMRSDHRRALQPRPAQRRPQGASTCTPPALADTAYFGPEAEFFIFDDIRFDQTSNSGYYYIDSDEGVWNSGRDEDQPNLGYKPRYKEGYFPVPPTDQHAGPAHRDDAAR